MESVESAPPTQQWMAVNVCSLDDAFSFTQCSFFVSTHLQHFSCIGDPQAFGPLEAFKLRVPPICPQTLTGLGGERRQERGERSQGGSFAVAGQGKPLEINLRNRTGPPALGHNGSRPTAP